MTNTLKITNTPKNNRDQDYKFVEIDLPKDLETYGDDYFKIMTAVDLEQSADDPPRSHDKIRKELQNASPYYKIHRWLVYRSDTVVGYTNLSYTLENSPDYEANKNQCGPWFYVLQEYRGMGIGKSILEFVLDQAQKRGKQRIDIWTNLKCGQEFLNHMGGKLTFKGFQNRLYIDQIDWEKMDRWISEGLERATGVTIEQFSEVPEKDIEEYCKVHTETLNQAPIDDLEGEEITTPESRRNAEKRTKASGTDWITLISREPDGNISGLTEILWNPEEPHIVNQELTGVKQEYRGRGLGKWLKAQMLYEIKDRFPSTRYIDTGNAQSNGPMLSINNGMGYKPIKEGHIYSFFTEE